MKHLKQLLSGLMAVMMMTSLAACGGSGDTNSGTSTGSAGSAASTGEPAAAPTDVTYTVGICQLVQHDALDKATEGFKDTLTELLGDAVKFEEQNAANDSATCATICTGFVSEDVDLIMANATPALQAAAAATSEIPVLGTSVTEYGVAMGIDNFNGVVGGNVSGTSDLAPLDQQAAMVHDLFPDAKTIGILYCSAEPNSVYQAETIKGYLTDFGYAVNVYTFADSNDVSSVAATACGECDALYIPTDNTAAACAEAINNVAQPAGVPIVAGEEGICAGCGVATLSISYYDIGCKTAEMAYDILVNGADISTMAIEYAPQFTKKYNPTLCEALGITVPDDYVAIG